MTPDEPQPVTGDVQAALDAGLANADPTPLDRNKLYSLALPHGGAHMVLDTEQYGARPWRPRATYRPATVGALEELIARYKDEDTTIWVHPTSGRVDVIFNDNAPDATGWRDHSAVLALAPTPEWEHWTSQDNVQMSQQAFAEHIEDGLLELVDPPAADMLELAQTVEATQGANFRSAIRLQDGQVQAKYEETIDAKAGQSGQLTIPTEFKLAIAPFLGESPYSLTARFRYRLNSGRLTLGYRLERPDAVVRDALAQIAERLRSSSAPNPVLIGEPR